MILVDIFFVKFVKIVASFPAEVAVLFDSVADSHCKPAVNVALTVLLLRANQRNGFSKIIEKTLP